MTTEPVFFAPLIKDLSEAPEGSRVLDRRVALATGWENRLEGVRRDLSAWKAPGESMWIVENLEVPPFFTTSLDAAASLIPPHATGWQVGSGGLGVEMEAIVWTLDQSTGRYKNMLAKAATAPLAIVAAALAVRGLPLTWEQKLAALNNLAEASLKMIEPGRWTVVQRVEIKDGIILKGPYAVAPTPEAAIAEHWRQVTKLRASEYLVANAYQPNRYPARWNGWEWEAVQEPGR